MKNVLRKPLITEKMTGITDKNPSRFGFIVDKKASKSEIKQSVKMMYNVDVVSINTAIYSGKKRMRGMKRRFITGRTVAYKKAIVTLKEGQTIDFYSNI